MCGNSWQLLLTFANFCQLSAIIANFPQFLATLCNFYQLVTMFATSWKLVAISENLLQLGPGRPSAGGPRMDRRAVTSPGVVKISRLSGDENASQEFGEVKHCLGR